MKAEVVEVRGLTFVGRADTNHWVTLDASEDLNGNQAGTRPLELVLIAMGGCTAMDVASILKKMQVKYDSLEISITAEKAEQHPKYITKAHIKYLLYGKDIDTTKLEKAIKLSMDTYCSVTAMVRKTAEITTEYEIIGPGNEQPT